MEVGGQDQSSVDTLKRKLQLLETFDGSCECCWLTMLLVTASWGKLPMLEDRKPVWIRQMRKDELNRKLIGETLCYGEKNRALELDKEKVFIWLEPSLVS